MNRKCCQLFQLEPLISKVVTLQMQKLLIIVGTRPNFIKVTQFKKVNKTAFDNYFDIRIAHTGQHYDKKMADVFFEQFELEPDFFLNVPIASPNTQTAEIMLRLEKVLKEKFMPELLIVLGDVNSTFATALTANKMGIPLAHVESGLRSRDRSMPEEINRLLTDEITDFFFVTEQSGVDNLVAEGKPNDKIHFVGNTMIDTLVGFESNIQQSQILSDLEIKGKEYILMTMHRPANVDTKSELEHIANLISQIAEQYPIIFPIHPRTKAKFEKFELFEELFNNPNIIISGPLDYFAFQKLIADAVMVLTDSGGIQEETTFRKVPCLTLRPNTERPSTIELGTNQLIPFDAEVILKEVGKIKKGTYKKGTIPPLWDGKSTQRILEIIKEL
jgi:UDP-N-acetylglucosamine 2-epimerase (non-hydrolysing)